MRALIFSLLALTTFSCSRVMIKSTDEEGTHHLTVPFSALKAALQFSEAGELTIEDLGGVDESLDLRAIAKALREPGAEKMSFSMSSEDSEIEARIAGRSFSIESRSKQEDSSVTLNLPLALLDLFAEAGERPVSSSKMLDAIKRQKGVLLDVKDEDGWRQIVIK